MHFSSVQTVNMLFLNSKCNGFMGANAATFEAQGYPGVQWRVYFILKF